MTSFLLLFPGGFRFVEARRSHSQMKSDQCAGFMRSIAARVHPFEKIP
jgi:hypothetical protein